MERLITVSDAAQRLGVTKKTLQVWDNDGKLTALRTAGGHRRYRQSDVDKLQGLETEESNLNRNGSEIMSKFKVGDEVYRIEKLEVDQVKAESIYFTNGSMSLEDDDRLFIASELPPEIVNFLCPFKKDDKVMVRDRSGAEWEPRHFSHKLPLSYACFATGSTSWTSEGGTTEWAQCRFPTEEELNS